ncbi:hypothetical protein [Candidatus Cyanaurora vandensis]|uniref:hypothetical protein n=1 Tax=Candidatus Cyanaurora vandensis TaxID=2714958 RepID=UPI002580DCC2|nr:hypothetical protein [Candidatus Cyanaurora vandensis]
MLVQQPDQPLFWYSLHQALDCVPIIVEQRLQAGKPVWQLLSSTKYSHARAEYGPPPVNFLTKLQKLWRP